MISSGRCHGPGCPGQRVPPRLAGLAERGLECGTACSGCGAMLWVTPDGDLVPVRSSIFASPQVVPDLSRGWLSRTLDWWQKEAR